MQYFIDTVETIVDGVGFPAFGALHLIWLGVFVGITVANCLWYRKMETAGKARWRKVIAVLLIADELFKMVMLFIGGNYMAKYLPLHLCSINIFVIAIHAWKPSKTLGSFLYTVCIPGAIAALLFPTWTPLPLGNFMHLHSFSIHILLAMYPIVLTYGGDIKTDASGIPKCLLLLVGVAVPVFFINLLLDTNFMFLMYAEPGNPLMWFQQTFGNHLIGFPVLIAAVIAVMYLPPYFRKKMKKKIPKA